MMAFGLAVGVALATLFFLFSPERGARGPAQAPPPEAPMRAAAPPPVDRAPVLPPPREEPIARAESPPVQVAAAPPGIRLDASDEIVRQSVLAVVSSPLLAKWLMSEDLVRRFVASVDNIAEGLSPRRHLLFLAPEGRFEAQAGDEGGLFVAPKSFARYDLITEIFLAFEAEDAVALYQEIRPSARQAFRELGYPDEDFDDRLALAIEELLATPEIEAPVALEPLGTHYAFADPSLEDLSGAQRQLLRMGPKNASAIQRRLSEIEALLHPRK